MVKRGWFANGLDFELYLKSGSPAIWNPRQTAAILSKIIWNPEKTSVKIQSSLDFKCFQISNGCILDPHCKFDDLYIELVLYSDPICIFNLTGDGSVCYLPRGPGQIVDDLHERSEPRQVEPGLPGK